MRHLALGLAGLIFVACGGDSFNNDDAGADAGVPSGCDLAKTPMDSAACVTDEVGVFVDGTGGNDQTGDGTKEHPFKTIGHALDNLGGKPRVYVCQGHYLEDVSLQAKKAASLIGGLECGDWAYNASSVPTIGASNLPLRITVPDRGILISDVSVAAGSGSNPGESSIAALVSKSKDVTFVRVVLTAGRGSGGASAVPPSAAMPPVIDLKGHDSTGNSGGAAMTYSKCPTGETTTGGQGGDSGSKGDDGMPALGGGAGGGGGNVSCQGGGGGSAGKSGGDGVGAATLGDFAPDGTWMPTAGGDGANGGVGQGGGGGGGNYNGGNTGGGGGGGAGGCGGPGGKGGGGGGASAALAVDTSKVHVFASQLFANDAGDGGRGVTGIQGMPQGGARGNGYLDGCSGGGGGPGGNGGSGGGGAGGVSAALLIKGLPLPDVDSATKTKVGNAGAAGSGAGANDDGIPGLAQAQVTIP